MNKMIELGSVWAFPFGIVALEKGKWDDKFQDWYAVLVTNGGGRIPVELTIKTVKGRLESARESVRLAQKR